MGRLACDCDDIVSFYHANGDHFGVEFRLCNKMPTVGMVKRGIYP